MISTAVEVWTLLLLCCTKGTPSWLTLPLKQARRPEAAAGLLLLLLLLLLLHAVLAVCCVAAGRTLCGLCPALGRYPLITTSRDDIAVVSPLLLLVLLVAILHLLLVPLLLLLVLCVRPTVRHWG
jgi:hypothetical protein